MDTQAGIKDTARKLLFPAAVSLVGGGLGWLLSRNPKQLAQAIPQLPEGGIGELKDDLRGRLDSVLGKDEAESQEEQRPDINEPDERPDMSEFEERRRERQQRRDERKQRLKA
jgi:hypothetical protein